MADTLDVLTLTEGKNVVGIASSDATEDTDLAAFITGISRRLDTLVGPIVNRTLTDELHNGGLRWIQLDYWPVASVTSVSEYVSTTETTLTAETNSTKPANAYMLYDENGRVYRRATNADACFATGRRNVKVTYVAGRAATTAAVDERFKRAAGIMLQNLWRSQEQGLFEADEFQFPRQNFPHFAIPNAVKELLHDEWQAFVIGA